MKIMHAALAAGSTVACPVGPASRLLALAGVALAGLAISTAAAQPGVSRPGVRWPAPEALAPVAPDPASAPGAAEADALVEPLALYPEQVLIAIFRASQHPLDVVRAARWFKAGNSGEAAAAQPWAANLTGLLDYPALIEAMDADIDRTQRLGELARTQPEALWSAVDRQRAAQGQPPAGLAGTQEPGALFTSAPRPASTPLTTSFTDTTAPLDADSGVETLTAANDEISSVVLPSAIAAPVWTTPVIVAPFVPRRSVWFVSGWGSPWCGWNDAWAFRWRHFYSRPSFALSVSVGSDPWRWSRWDCRPVSSWNSSWHSSWHSWPRRSVVVVSRPVGHWGGWSHWDQPFCEPAWDSGLSLSISYSSGHRRGWGNGWTHGSGKGWDRGHDRGHHPSHEPDQRDRGGRDRNGIESGPRDFAGGELQGDSPRMTGAFGPRPQQEVRGPQSGWPLLRASQLASNTPPQASFEGSRRVTPPDGPVGSSEAGRAATSARVLPATSTSELQARRPSPPGIMRVAERARRTADPLPAVTQTAIAEPRTVSAPPSSGPSPRSSAARPIPSIRPADNLRRGVVSAPGAMAEPRDSRPAPRQAAVQPRSEVREVMPAPAPEASRPARIQPPRQQAPARSAYPVARAAQQRASEPAPQSAPRPAPQPAPQPRAEAPRESAPQAAPAQSPAARKPIPSIRPRDNIRRGVK